MVTGPMLNPGGHVLRGLSAWAAGTAAGALMYTLMYAAALPLENNPVVDDHLIGIIVMVVLALAAVGGWWYFTKRAPAPSTTSSRRARPRRRPPLARATSRKGVHMIALACGGLVTPNGTINLLLDDWLGGIAEGMVWPGVVLIVVGVLLGVAEFLREQAPDHRAFVRVCRVVIFVERRNRV